MQNKELRKRMSGLSGIGCVKTRERKWDNFKCGIAAGSDRILSSMRNEEGGFKRRKIKYISAVYLL